MATVSPNKETLLRNHWKAEADELVDKLDPSQVIMGLAGSAITVITVVSEPALQPLVGFVIVSV